MSGFGSMVDPLLEELDLDVSGRHVVALGGGHGLAQALLAIQDYADAITAIVSVADDGGSSGRLAPALGIPPPGDIRRALLALSPEPSVWRQLMEHRFGDGDVAGHSLGNLMLAALAAHSGGFTEALHTAGRLLGARGAVIPAAEVALGLEAIIDGATVTGQVAVMTTPGTIESIRTVPPDATATGAAVAAIGAADQIVLGPGSLFTSVIAILKVPGITDAINGAAGRLVYVSNLITQDSETLGLDGPEHVRALLEHTGIRAPDVLVAHEGPLEIPDGLEQIRLPAGTLDDLPAVVERSDIADPAAEWPQHHPARLGAVLRRLP